MIRTKCFLLFFVMGILLFSPNVSAFKVDRTSSGSLIRWYDPVEQGVCTIGLTVDEDTFPSQAALDAVHDAYGTWNRASLSRPSWVIGIDFYYAGNNFGGAEHGVLDDANLIDFGPLNDSSVLAENIRYYSSSTGQMWDFDIRFNNAKPWGTSGAPGVYDVQNVFTHELGHSLPLRDLYDPADSEKTMYGYVALSEIKKRTLDQDDIDGMYYLYSYAGGVFGELHMNSVTGPPLAGAAVICGGESSTTRSDGSYSLSHVPEGSQTLSFSKPGYQSSSRTVTIIVGQSLDAGDDYLIPPRSDGVFPDSTVLGGGWKWSPWFGYYYDANPSWTGSQGWVYHLQHDWLYVREKPGNGIFLWGEHTGWWWTSSTTYPNVYSFDDQSWLWYDLGSTNPRWFYNYQRGRWEGV